MNPGLPIHAICSDKRVFRDFLQNKKVMPMISLKLISSFIEFFNDIPYNIRSFRFPVLVMMAEHEELVNNATSEKLLNMA